MKALSNMSRLTVSHELLLSLLRVYESKGKEFYYDDLFQRDEAVFSRTVVENNVFYLAKFLDLDITDARLRILTKKDVVAKNRTETLILNIKSGLSKLQKHSKNFELIVNEIIDLTKVLSMNLDQIKFMAKEKDANDIFGGVKKVGNKRADLEDLLREYERQNKTRQYERTQMIANLYIDFLNMKIFNIQNELIIYIIMYALLLSDFNVFKYTSFFEALNRHKNIFETGTHQGNYTWASGFVQVDMLTNTLIDILKESYQQIDLFAKSYAFELQMNKSNNIEATILKGNEIFSKDDIRLAHPTIAKITIDRTLKRLKDEGKIMPLGKGRASKWQRLAEPRRKGGEQLSIFSIAD